MSNDREDAPVALVTGGGTGVGAATARRLAKRGYNIVIVYRSSADDAEDVARDCRAAGVEALTVPCDVAEDADCRAAVDRAKEAWGRIDVLVNSAGVTQFTSFSDLDSQNAEDFQKVFAVNVIGAYQMARAAAPLMRGGGMGAIVNISSMSAETGNGSSLAYVASKGALNTLTLSLARLFAPEIRVNAVVPGLIDSGWFLRGMSAERYAKVRDSFAAASALGAVCSPDDIAQAVEFLAVDAKKMTGQLMAVEAGALLGAGAVNVSKAGGKDDIG
jgi:3-oxoacyl-[acyl-carrier protein] reductase